MKITRTLTATLATLTLGLMLVSTALPAAAQDIPNHPRVNQVNGRVMNQKSRVMQGVKNGTITRPELGQLKSQRMGIKSEEHTMRASDNGHLTRADQKALNQQLNGRSKEIFQDKHPMASPSTTP